MAVDSSELEQVSSNFHVSQQTLERLSASLAVVRATVNTDTAAHTRVRRGDPTYVSVSLRHTADDTGEGAVVDEAEARPDYGAVRALGELPVRATVVEEDEPAEVLTTPRADQDPTRFPAWPERTSERGTGIHDDIFGDIADAKTEELPIRGVGAEEGGEDDEDMEEPVTLATEGLDAETEQALYDEAQQELDSLLERLDNASYNASYAGHSPRKALRRKALRAILQEPNQTGEDFWDLVNGDDAHHVALAVRDVFKASDLAERADPAAKLLVKVLGINVHELAAAGLLVTDHVKLDIESIAYRLADYMNNMFEYEMGQTEQDTDEADATDATPDSHRVTVGRDVAQSGAQLRESIQRGWSRTRGWFSQLRVGERIKQLGGIFDSGAAAQDPETMRYVQQAQVRIPGQTTRTPAVQPQPVYPPSGRNAQPNYPQRPAPRGGARNGSPAAPSERAVKPDPYPDWLR